MAPKTIALRNTCFALLSAIECDLRQLVVDSHVSSQGQLTMMPDDVRLVATERARRARDLQANVPVQDAVAIEFTDFADLAKMLDRTRTTNPLGAQAATAISQRLIAMVPARNRVCQSRPLEPDDFAELYDFGSILQGYSGRKWDNLAATLQMLEANPAAVLQLKIPSYWAETRPPRVSHNLPLPDFDETGFLGRSSDRTRLHKLLAGSLPVITIVGEGGVGKTALALRCLYDIVDSEGGNRFDTIVWSSFKNRALTPAGIQELRQTFDSALGALALAATAHGLDASHLNGAATIEERLIEYMGRHKAILVIDNLETMDDPTALRPLLEAIPQGTKVLITSRVGLGELELRFALEPLDEAAATDLVRRYARLLNVNLLLNQTEAVLHRFCRALHFNPLLLKWFIHSVALGALPEDLLSREGSSFADAIRFCFENLFTRLGPDEHLIVNILACARKPLTRVELFVVSELRDRDKLDIALNRLYNSSVVRMLPGTGAQNGSTTYALGDLAHDYLTRWLPRDKLFFALIQSRLRELAERAEEHDTAKLPIPYGVSRVEAKNRDQKIAASYLKKAVVEAQHASAVQQEDEPAYAESITRARSLVEEAKMILPTYSEAFRVSAYVETSGQNFQKADGEYRAAIDYDPESGPARYGYAHFLMYSMKDNEAALDQIEEALKKHPQELSLIDLRATLLIRLRRFEDASLVFEESLANIDTAKRPRKYRIVLFDRAADCFRRMAAQDALLREDARFTAHLDRGLDIVEEAWRRGDHDSRTAARYMVVANTGLAALANNGNEKEVLLLLQRLAAHRGAWEGAEISATTFEMCSRAFPGDSEVRRLLGEFPRSSGHSGRAEHGEEKIGVIARVLRERDFAFVQDDSGREWFLSRRNLAMERDWDKIVPGALVSFHLGADTQGRPKAVNARIRREHAESTFSS